MLALSLVNKLFFAEDILTCDEENQSKRSRMKRVEEKIGAEGGKEEEEEAESRTPLGMGRY